MSTAKRVVDRVLAAAAVLDRAAFIAELESLLNLDGRRIIVNRPILGSSATVYINFINLPEGVGGAGGGAEAENNRMMFSVGDFTKEGGPPPSGKVKVEMKLSMLPREYKLRAKSGPPQAAAKYLADFINKVVKEVPPHFTHTKQP